MKVIGFFALFGFASLAGASSDQMSGDRSIGKVVDLLKEMLEKSKKDGDEDRDLYAKFKCYCDDNEEEKKMAIEEYTNQMGVLENKIGELKGTNGELSQEIVQLKADMAENEAARAEAEAIRKKAREDFKAEEEDMVNAIGQMEKAIEVLDALVALQTESASTPANSTHFMAGKAAKKSDLKLINLQASVRQALVGASVFLTQKQQQSVQDLIQSDGATQAKRASGIVDVLKMMKETFEKNLANAQKADQAAEQAFKDYMDAKKVAFDEMKGSVEDKEADMGMKDEDLASKKEQYADLEKTKADDEAFLEKLLQQCAEKAKTYEERKLIRMNEQAAISEAINILDSEAGFATFGKVKATSTGGTGAAMLLQLRSASGELAQVSDARARASVLMEAAAKKARSLRLARIAVLLQGDNPFTLIFEEIDKVIELIAAEGEEDQKNLDWCNKEREERDADIEEKKSQIETLNQEIEELDSAINDPETGLIAQIKETEVSLTQNSESQASETKTRHAENIAYQKYANNLEEAELLLTKAVEVLKKHFEGEEEEASAAVLAQTLVKEDPDPPSTFDDAKSASQSDAGKKVIKMLDFILEETKKEAQECHGNEEKSQKDYEDSMTELKKEEEDLQKSLAELQETLAEKKALLEEKKVSLEETTADKVAIEAYLEKIKGGCDFITENFDTREKNRETEKKALEEAKDILKGTPAYKKFASK